MPTIGTEYLVKVPVTKAADYRRKVVSFGGGYQQRSLEGINYLKESWDITFFCFTLDQKTALEAIVNAAGGVIAIDWLAPGDAAPKKWLFTGLRLTAITTTYWELTCNAEFVNEP